MADKTVDATEAQANLVDLLTFVREGHEVLISDGDRPVARLVPVSDGETAESTDPPRRKRKRTLGLTRGAGWMAPDFYDPLPDSFWLGES